MWLVKPTLEAHTVGQRGLWKKKFWQIQMLKPSYMSLALVAQFCRLPSKQSILVKVLLACSVLGTRDQLCCRNDWIRRGCNPSIAFLNVPDLVQELHKEGTCHRWELSTWIRWPVQCKCPLRIVASMLTRLILSRICKFVTLVTLSYYFRLTSDCRDLNIFELFDVFPVKYPSLTVI